VNWSDISARLQLMQQVMLRGLLKDQK
jgi:hypothetical protein